MRAERSDGWNIVKDVELSSLIELLRKVVALDSVLAFHP